MTQTTAAAPAAAPAPFDPIGTESSPGPAWSAAFLGVVGLIVALFMPWGAVLSVLAVVLGFVARRGFPETRGARLTAIITGFVGIIVAVVWVAVVLLAASMVPGDNF